MSWSLDERHSRLLDFHREKTYLDPEERKVAAWFAPARPLRRSPFQTAAAPTCAAAYPVLLSLAQPLQGQSGAFCRGMKVFGPAQLRHRGRALSDGGARLGHRHGAAGAGCDADKAMADAAWLGEELLQAAKGEADDAARVGAALDQGADIEWRDATFHNLTALMWASRRGHVECVRLLLERGAEVDAAQLPEQNTALMIASRMGRLAVVKLLDAAGADIHHKDTFGNNALIFAATYDRLPVCLFLLSKGADLMEAANNNATALTHYGRNVHNPPLSPATLAERCTALEEAWRAGPHPSQVQRRRDEAWDRRKSLMQVSAENGYRPLLHRQLAIALKAVADLSSQVAAQQKQIAAQQKAFTLIVASQQKQIAELNLLLAAAAAGGPVVMPAAQAPALAEQAAVVDPAAAIPAIPLDNAEQVHAHLLGQVLSNEGIHRNIVSML